MISNKDRTRTAPLRVAMLVVDANEVDRLPIEDEVTRSPILHPAIHNLLEGLRGSTDIEIEVIYGRMQPSAGEDRWDGCLHYVPIPYKNLPIPGMGGAYLGRLLALLRHLGASKPDVVHAQGTERESGLVAALSRIPSLLTVHGNFRAIARAMGAKFPSYCWLNARIESRTLPYVRGILCISKYTQQLVTPLNKRTWLVPNPAVSSYFKLPYKPKLNHIVCLGAIGERKNQILLIDACTRLAAQGLEFHLDFWGPITEDQVYSQEFLRKIGENSWSSYKGNAEIGNVPGILAEAHLLVLPSLEDNCPMVVIEAMSIGVPVVASDVGGIPDLVEHQVTGLLFETNNVVQLAQSIETVLKDTHAATSFSIAARKVAEERFHPDAVAKKHIEIYRELAGSS